MRVAVLVDAENIEVAQAAAVIEATKPLGDLNIVRLYGDFTELRLSGWLELARQHGFQPRMQLSGGRGKNSTDINLTIDAMDLLFAGATDGFCLVSDDRDFVPLASRLRAAGKRVFVICRKADARLEHICSKVITLAAAQPKVSESETLKAAFSAMGFSDGRWVRLSEAGSNLAKHMPEFAPQMLGAGKLRIRLMATGMFEEALEGNAVQLRLKRG